MHGRLPALALLAPLLAGAFTGCLGADTLDPAALAATGVRVVDAEGAPVPFAAVTLVTVEGAPVAALGTDAAGVLRVPALPAGARGVVVTASGFDTWSGGLAKLPERIVLTPLAPDARVDPLDATPVLRFLPPVKLGGTYLGGDEASCRFTNCGGSEPTVEVAADGTIYASAVCCVGASPPVWRSTDGGFTWTQLEGDLLREGFGIEGDFAIDDAGNLYFSDISAASSYFSSWDKDGNHRWTVPAYPFPPLVDRPWVRAGAADEVFFAYNTGFSTRFHKSTDGARTWDAGVEFPAGLGALGQGPERDHLYVTAGGVLYESTNGGATWSSGEEYPHPTTDGNTWQAYEVPVADEAGNLWIVYDWREKPAEDDSEPYHVYAVRRDTAGAWHGPFRVSPEEGTHHLPWPATGREGTLVVAWYGTVDDAAGPNGVADDAQWHVYTAVTVDGLADAPHFQVVRADPEPVHAGPMNRKLLDFLQVDVGPDGAAYVVYAEDRGGRADELSHVVRTTTGLGLAPKAYPNGPK